MTRALTASSLLLLTLVALSPGASATPRSVAVSSQVRMTCFHEIYTPALVTLSGTRYGHFGAKILCGVPVFAQVCVRPQELIAGSWVSQADFSCGPWTSGFEVARNETYRCSELGNGVYRTRARFTSVNGGTNLEEFGSSSQSRPCN